MGEVHIYSWGLVSCSVCAPKDMPIEEVTSQVNIELPTGISSQWSNSEDTHFAQGQTNPCVCESNPDRLHYLFTC